MKNKNFIWGLFLLILGIVLGLNSLNITNIDLFFPGWWTLFIIIPSLNNLIKKSNKMGSIIWLVIGVSLLLMSLDIISFDKISNLIFPMILILCGLSIIFKDTLKRDITNKIKELSNDNNNVDYCTTFANQAINIDEDKLGNKNINTIFGETTLDISRSNIDKDIVIENLSLFGKTIIVVPNDVNVMVKSMCIFGEATNKIINDKDRKKTIYINTSCIFGGILIK